jgi:hypothetical protein
MKITKVCLLLFLFCVRLGRAEDFGDVAVAPNAIYTGNTYHGYAEIRVALENHSHTRTHAVTLVYPNRSYDSGNVLRRLSRTVSLGPDAREVVPLLQPPLPVRGDASIRVEVDGRNEGTVHAPNANNHCSQNYWRGGGGSEEPAAVLISRSLDYDAVTRVFQPNGGAFTAVKAVGPPDAGGTGYQPGTWMPDTRAHSRDNWLELDYATPQSVSRIKVFYTQPPSGLGTVILLGTTGTNVASLPMSSGRTTAPGYARASSSGWETEFVLPTTSEAVKTVRLDFGKTPPTLIAVDAVQISGPTNSQWAADARASSDNSAHAGSFLSGRPGGEVVEGLRSESPISEWSEDWLAYSPFDAVVVNAADLAAMTPAVFSALGDYVQAGGNLLLLGRGDLPPSWHPAQTQQRPNGAEFEIGFGRVFALAAENPALLDAAVAQQLRDTVRGTANYFRNLPSDSGAANGVMPVVENVRIPTRGIIIAMVVFVVLIGPVNIIYLNRIQRRTWMLWTIPAISLVTTLLVFVYSLLREGITPDTRLAGLTVLDQTSRQAATIGGEAFYCPLTPGGGLNFELATEVTPLVNRYGSGASREVDWTAAQHFGRGWVASRVPAHFHLRKAGTRRERLQVINENGRLQIVNSLGARIKFLWLADADMNMYRADNVGAGEKGGLIPAKLVFAGKAGAGAAGLLHDLGYTANPETLTDAAGRYLVPNSYLVVLDGNPFLENALAASSPKRTRSSAVVFGLLEAPVGGAHP